MTTIKDLLNDFAEELLLGIAEETRKVDPNKPFWADRAKEFKKKIKLSDEAWTNKKEILIDEYIETIKNRFIG